MSRGPDISVIVVNYNGREHLDTCLRALEAQQNVQFECVFVDNGSRDQSASFVRERFPWIRLIEKIGRAHV